MTAALYVTAERTAKHKHTQNQGERGVWGDHICCSCHSAEPARGNKGKLFKVLIF